MCAGVCFVEVAGDSDYGNVAIENLKWTEEAEALKAGLARAAGLNPRGRRFRCAAFLNGLLSRAMEKRLGAGRA